MVQWKHLFRKAHNGTIKTFIIARHKWYNKNICSARRKMAINMWPLRGQDKKTIPDHHALGGTNFPKIPHLTPLGSHVSSILGRKAYNVTMKPFVPPWTKWYNETICSARRTMLQWNHLFRQAHNGTMKPFVPPGAQCYNETICSARDKMAINMWPLRGQDKKTDPRPSSPGGTNFPKIPHLTPLGSHVYKTLWPLAA